MGTTRTPAGSETRGAPSGDHPNWRVELTEEACTVVVSLPHLETATEVGVEMNAAGGQIRISLPPAPAPAAAAGLVAGVAQELLELEIPVPKEARTDTSHAEMGSPPPVRWSRKRRELSIGFGRRNSPAANAAAGASRAATAQEDKVPRSGRSSGNPEEGAGLAGPPPEGSVNARLPKEETLEGFCTETPLPPQQSVSDDPKAPVPGFEEGAQGTRFRKTDNWATAGVAKKVPSSSGSGAGGGRRLLAGSSLPSSGGMPVEPVAAPSVSAVVDQEIEELGFGRPGEEEARTQEVQEQSFAAKTKPGPAATSPGRPTPSPQAASVVESWSRGQPEGASAGARSKQQGYPAAKEEELDMGEVLDVDSLMAKLREKGLQPGGNSLVSVDPATGKAQQYEVDPVAVDMASALMLGAAASVGDVQKVRSLLEAKVDPDVADDAGISPLEKACSAGELGTATLLLKAGAKANGLKSSNSTPLHRAKAGGFAPLVNLLLKHGADPQRRDRAGRRAEAMVAP